MGTYSAEAREGRATAFAELFSGFANEERDAEVELLDSRRAARLFPGPRRVSLVRIFVYLDGESAFEQLVVERRERRVLNDEEHVEVVRGLELLLGSASRVSRLSSSIRSSPRHMSRRPRPIVCSRRIWAWLDRRGTMTQMLLTSKPSRSMRTLTMTFGSSMTIDVEQPFPRDFPRPPYSFRPCDWSRQRGSLHRSGR